MDTFHVTLETPKGETKIFTACERTFEAIKEVAHREYPRHTVKEIENATTGETKTWER